MTFSSVKPVAPLAMMCALAMFFFGTHSSWAQKAPLTQEAQSALDYFLNRDCGIGEQRSALDRLLDVNRQFSGAIENALRDILLNDAFSYSVVHIKEGLTRNWDDRRAFLAKGKHTGLTDPEVKQLIVETKDAYVERNLSLYKAKRQHNAILALVAIGSDTAFATLSDARNTGDAALQSIIDASLKRAKSPPPARNPRNEEIRRKVTRDQLSERR